MSEEIKFTEEELNAYLVERIGDFGTDYIDIMKYWEIFGNKPMVERERQKYDNTISAIRDSLMFKRMTFRNAFGENIYTALNDAFENLFDAGDSPILLPLQATPRQTCAPSWFEWPR